MYNEYDDEDNVEETPSRGKLADFYYNNKKLVWLLLGMIGLILVLSLFSKGGGTSSESKVTIYSDGKDVTNTEIVLSTKNVIQLSPKVDGKSGVFVKWSEGDKNIATVDSSGNVRGVAVGTTDIMAIYSDKYTAKCTIKVVEGNVNIKLKSAGFPDGELYMGVGDQYSIDIVAKPSDGYVTSRTFKSNDTSVVTVDDSGVVKAVSKGSAKISVNINDGDFTDDLMVYVSDKVDSPSLVKSVKSIKFNSPLEKIELGKKTQLTFETEPTDASLSSIYWKSNNEAVVKVDEESGELTGVSLGTALIKVYSLIGNQIETITVEVVESLTGITSISVPYPSITMKKGETITIKPTVKPDSASNKGLTYTSSDTSVATVSSNDGGISATIKAVSSGTATIVVSSANGKTATINVTVNSTGSSDSGGSYDPHDDKGYSISSKDANDNGIICRSYEYTSKDSNIGEGPVKVTFKITSSSTSSLKVCTYKYDETACNPDKDTTGVKVIKKNSSNNYITIDETGVWVVVVSEYNGTSRKSTLKWYARLDSASGKTVNNNNDDDDSNNNNNNNSKVTCCYKNSSGKYAYGSVESSKCSSKYKNYAKDKCLALNNQQTAKPQDDDDDDDETQNVKCCYKSSGTWTYDDSVTETTCKSRTSGQVVSSEQVCLDKNGGSGNVTITRVDSSKVSGTVYGGGWFNPKIDVNMYTVSFTNIKNSYIIHYCVDCNDAQMNQYHVGVSEPLERDFSSVASSVATTCISGEPNKIYEVDGSFITGSSYGGANKIKFCFKPNQSLKIVVRNSNLSSITSENISFS